MIQIQPIHRPTGRAEIAREGDKIESISVWIEEPLQSMRDKEFSARMSTAANMKINRAGDVWFARLLSLDLHTHLRVMQYQCGFDGICIDLVATVRKKRPARDYKDRLVGFDHMILDPLVRHGVLIDDDEENVYLVGCTRDRSQGPDLLYFKFSRSTVPCRESVTKQILEFGWPDPDYRRIPKEQRRKELRKKLTAAKSGGLL